MWFDVSMVHSVWIGCSLGGALNASSFVVELNGSMVDGELNCSRVDR